MIQHQVDLTSAAFAPRDLIYNGTFNQRERAEIEAQPELRAQIHNGSPSDTGPSSLRIPRTAYVR